MNVQKMEEQDVNAVCGMVNERLLTSREAVVQLKGLSDRMGLLRPYTHACIRHWRRIGEVWVIGENQGLLAGHFAKNETAFSTICHGLNMMRGVLGSLSKEDRSRLVRNMKQSAGAQNVKWRKQVCGKGDYYYIDLVVIDRSLKGSGAFRRLLEPLLLRMEREGMPVLLDTHDPDNVPLYRHFGFETVREHRAKGDCDLVQYSMIRRPESC